MMDYDQFKELKATVDDAVGAAHGQDHTDAIALLAAVLQTLLRHLQADLVGE